MYYFSKKFEMELKTYIATTIGNGKLKDALTAFMSWASDTSSPLFNTIIALSGQFNRAENSFNTGLSTQENYNITLARLSNALLDVAEDIPAGATTSSELPPSLQQTTALPQVGPQISNSNLLFLAANPADTTELDLKSEFIKLFNQLQNSPYSVKTQWATTPAQLQDALLNYRPRIIHFSGHGTAGTAATLPDNNNSGTRAIGNVPTNPLATPAQTEGIFLQDAIGNKKFVSGVALANLFGTCLEKFAIDVVVLNACHSALQAGAIVQAGVKFVIGMSRAVPDDTAIQFTEGFYRTLSKENDIAFAFKMALNNIELEGGTGDDIPKLYQKSTA